MHSTPSQTSPILPWHSPQWQQLSTTWPQDRLPHALLLSGPKGMGKFQFAQRLANLLLCNQYPLPPFSPQSDLLQPCGHCKPCHLFQIGNHPDFSFIQPADIGKPIAVDQIRELIHFCSLTTSYGRYQIILLAPAEAMNRNAANSLLKLLEEPPPKTLFMLISHQPMALLATIRSRCQRLDFSRPDNTVTQHWLQQQIPHDLSARLLLNLTTQAPLAALELVHNEGLTQRRELFDTLAQLPTGKIDPISTAEQWNKLDIPQLLPWMLSWTMDLIRYASCGQAHLLVNQDRRETLQRLAKPHDLHNLFNLLDLETDAHRLIAAGANINTQGLLETIAMAWLDLGTPQRRK